MSFRWLIVLVLFSSLVAAQRTPKTHHYKFVDIRYPGAVSTTLQGINDNGDMVGTFLDSANMTHGFVLKSGAITQFDVPNSLSTYLRGVNNDGKIAGYYTEQDGLHAFTWTTAGFGSLPYSRPVTDPYRDQPFQVYAEGLNNNAGVVGMVYEPPANADHPKIWNGTTVTDFCPDAWVSGGYFAVHVRGIANSGLAVGFGLDGSQHTDDALIQDASGNCSKFDTGLNASSVQLTSVSSDGTRLAGHYATGPLQPVQVHGGFVWFDGSATPINFPKADDTVVNGVNTRGVLVGTATVNGKTIGFVAIPKGPAAK